MFLATDPRWISLLLLSYATAKSLDIDPLLLAADKLPTYTFLISRFTFCLSPGGLKN